MRVERVVVGSTNPVKRRATLEAVRAALGCDDVEAIGLEVPSGVRDQPYGDEETLQGARQRAEGARAARPDADLWVGLEGGVIERAGGLECMAWAVVLGASGLHGESRTATFRLPDAITELMAAGVELGDATDRVLGGHDIKRSSGTVGPLTGGVIDRVSYYAHALVLALIPFRGPLPPIG